MHREGNVPRTGRLRLGVPFVGAMSGGHGTDTWPNLPGVMADAHAHALVVGYVQDSRRMRAAARNGQATLSAGCVSGAVPVLPADAPA
ncbi:hypothetical protein Sviol_59990 [Streptomyces violascens]|uniref:Uncharacterized protein n=1 Tax=Streptomyces violascens TaxID=67381 RepID=A0ABQ3QWD3_9ACTN|nr:hypothetical protein Sviol_59990 [Streptomyces violascens]